MGRGEKAWLVAAIAGGAFFAVLMIWSLGL